MAELYVDQHLTLAEVAERVGGSATCVGAALDRHGIPRRPRGSRSLPGREPLTKEVLTELYVNQRLGSVTIARRLGGHPSRVLKALERFGIPVRPRPRPGGIDVDELAELYVERRMSLEDVADALGVSVNQVRVTLRQEKLRRPTAPRPELPAPPAAVLEDLYVTQGLTLSQIGRRYRTTHYRVHDWLVTAGIPVAPRTTRAHRRTLPRALLEVPAPRDRRRHSHVVAGADHADSVDRVLGRPLDTDAPGDERLERRQVVDHEGDPTVAGSDVADLACAQHPLTRPAHPQGRALDLQGDRGDIGLAVRGDGGSVGIGGTRTPRR